MNLTTLDVARKARVSYRQLDYWLRNGVIDIESDGAPGMGNARQFTATEIDDLMTLGRIINEAEAAGLTLTRMAVGDVWHALQKGADWTVTLSVTP